MAAPYTLGQIAAHIGGRIAGNADVLIRQVGSLERAGPGQIAFLTNRRHGDKLAATRASAVIVGEDAESMTSLPRLVCRDPYASFAHVSQLFNPAVTQAPGVHASATVSPMATLGQRVSIGPGCVVGEGVSIGDDSCLYPRVVIYPGCRIGARTILHSGVVIGADGFGIAAEDGRWVKIPQIGAVVIGDDVEIGANTTIDRGTLEDTVIGNGVKLDNQIQIGHNCHIGEHTAMAGCAGVAGSTHIGKRCRIGAAASILGHLTICDDATVSACTIISRSIHKPGTYTGMFPSSDHKSWLQNTVIVRHLAELAERVRGLEKRSKRNEGNHG
jgi:UDP-3-O-[3-hydroxymyristoyl] glucosamine N-acyltransferase